MKLCKSELVTEKGVSHVLHDFPPRCAMFLKYRNIQVRSTALIARGGDRVPSDDQEWKISIAADVLKGVEDVHAG